MTKNYAIGYFNHAILLQKLDRPAEALAFAEIIRPEYGTSRAEFNDLYIHLLIANKKEGVIAYIEKCLHENAATPEMLSILQAEYNRKNGSSKGFDEYVNKLKSSEKAKEQRAELDKSLFSKLAR